MYLICSWCQHLWRSRWRRTLSSGRDCRSITFSSWEFRTLRRYLCLYSINIQTPFRSFLTRIDTEITCACEQDDPRRGKFIAHVEGLMKNLVNYAPVDAAVDQKARDFLHDCLPPMLSAGESHSNTAQLKVRWCFCFKNSFLKVKHLNFSLKQFCEFQKIYV